MIHHQFLEPEGVLVLTPEAPFESQDFDMLAQEIDPYIHDKGKLNGLLIDAESFPGWRDFAGLSAHLKFVKNHQARIRKVAMVTDNWFLRFMPNIAETFLPVVVKHFSRSHRLDAFRWLTSVEKTEPGHGFSGT